MTSTRLILPRLCKAHLGKSPAADGLNGGPKESSQRAIHQRNGKIRSHSEEPILGAEVSAALRDQLMAELAVIASSEDATVWAHRILGAKNSLTAADARQVEDAFQAKLTTLGSVAPISDTPLSRVISTPRPSSSAEAIGTSIAESIDKSQLAHPEPRRIRDKDHVRFVAKQACLICGRRPSDAHHLRFAQHRALARKVSDEFTVPLCRGHHREVHHCGDEAAWWKKAGIDPTIPARSLWLKTHPLPATSSKLKIESATPVTAVGTKHRNGKTDRPIGKRAQKYKTKPIITAGPQ